MARNSKQTSVLEAKALKDSNKSEGMRTLFSAGYSVTQVRDLFKAPYGYVYGVAQRAGVAETAATRRVRKADDKSNSTPRRVASVKMPSVKVVKVVEVVEVKRGRGRPRKDGTPAQPRTATVVQTAGVPKRATATRPATATRTNGAVKPQSATSATARVAAKLAARAQAAKPGRPSPARRQLNRKVAVTA
jgi:hypothetical protein